MHLLTAQRGSLVETDEAVDLDQSPADVLFFSSADTELLCMSEARSGLGSDLSLRLVNILSLRHPLSVDTYCANTVRGSRLVIVRCLGGYSYWSYGLECLHSVCSELDIPLIVLSGDSNPDPSLDRFNLCDSDIRLHIFSLLDHGGIENARLVLEFLGEYLDDASEPNFVSARPLLRCGLWWRDDFAPDLATIRGHWGDDTQRGDNTQKDSVVGIIFYRSLVQSGNTEAISSLIDALTSEGLCPLPIFVSSLKDSDCCDVISGIFLECPPSVVINLTGFAVSSPDSSSGTILESGGAIVLQGVMAGMSRSAWLDSIQGLTSRDLAMNIALPEIDGRIFGRAIAFKEAEHYDSVCEANIVRHIADSSRTEFMASLAAGWVRLRLTPSSSRRVCMVLANYPDRDGRIGNGVGLDTPASLTQILHTLQESDYDLGDSIELNGESLISLLSSGVTNANPRSDCVHNRLSLSDYRKFYDTLPESVRVSVESRWGIPESDPFFVSDGDYFGLPIVTLGNVLVGIQPSRGYNIDPTSTYHSPDLVPPHNYFAFYFFVRHIHSCDAVCHLGKHGNMEWLPGKSLSLSESCYPEAVFGALPHLYPFIVNDPGEGSQAKRRSSAVILDHLTPPLSRAESYGSLSDLELLLDEYYDARTLDPRRIPYLRDRIVELARDTSLSVDAGIDDFSDDSSLERLDSWLCELKELQIRDGLHIFGCSPTDRLRVDLCLALVRSPRGDGLGCNSGFLVALSSDLNLDIDFGGLPLSTPWTGLRPDCLESLTDSSWRTYGDTIERLELLAHRIVSSGESWSGELFGLVLSEIRERVLPLIDSCGTDELTNFLTALNGRFVSPGPSGAPSRGRLDVLPTGRNFFSLDSRSVPTRSAWYLGERSADLLVRRHRQDYGEWPRSLGLSVWGTSNMRTGGDDIAQALALIGVCPVWDGSRVTGYEIIPVARLGRPRVDVTLRVSGFFRDAFPTQIELFDSAVRAVSLLDEDDTDNPIAMSVRSDSSRLVSSGIDADTSSRLSSYRVFGSKPGSYGAGLQALIDSGVWTDKSDLSDSYLSWGCYAYGCGVDGDEVRSLFESRLSVLDCVVHNQDNREHDLLDSDDYYQFEGGMSVSVECLSGTRPVVYHNDHSRPDSPVIRTLDEEISRVIRSRVVNPKWISGVMRHGYKGAFEIVATVDYLFSFAATTGSVKNHHFDLVYDSFLVDSSVRDFLESHNPSSLRELSSRLLEAIDRGLWVPRINSARDELVLCSGED